MSDMNRDGQLWLLKELYGFEQIPPEGDYESFIKAVLVCAKGDGTLAPEERSWVAGRAAAMQNPGYELTRTYPADDKLLDIVGDSFVVNKNGRRMILYVALQACAADGELHPNERAQVQKLAQMLGVGDEVFAEIERQCVEEAKLREQRIRLLFPNGTPF